MSSDEESSQSGEEQQTPQKEEVVAQKPKEAAPAARTELPSMREIAETAEVIVRSARLYQMKLEARKPGEQLDEKDLQSIQVVLKQFPNIFHLLKSKATQQMAVLEVALEQAASREDEWKSLSSLFTEYKNKVGQDIDNAKKLNAVMEKELKLAELENAGLKKKLVDLEDTMIRMDANQRRKENLARIKAEVDEEERKIALAIRELKASK